jgi:MFS family permease
MAAYLLFYTFQYLCLPLFPLAYVYDLKLTDGMISLGSGLFYITMFLVLRLGYLARRYGHRILLATSAMAFSLYPFFLGIAQGPLLYWVASILGGVVWGAISASLINRLMERVPDDQRASGMALHNLALNLGILVGSLSGPVLGDALGVQPALLVGAGLRFLAGVFCWSGLEPHLAARIGERPPFFQAFRPVAAGRCLPGATAPQPARVSRPYPQPERCAAFCASG